MHVIYNPKTSELTGQPETTLIHGDGIRLSARTEHAATVVAAAGEVDASNIDRLTDYVRAAVADGRGLILDLSDLTFFSAQGIPALFAVNEQCSKAGIDWAVVASHAVRRLLRIGDRDQRLPMVGSRADAMKRLATPAPAERLLQLVAKTG